MYIQNIKELITYWSYGNKQEKFEHFSKMIISGKNVKHGYTRFEK